MAEGRDNRADNQRSGEMYRELDVVETIFAQCACSEIQEETNEDYSPDCWDASSKIVSYTPACGNDQSNQQKLTCSITEDKHKTPSSNPTDMQVNVLEEKLTCSINEDKHKAPSSDPKDIQVNVLEDDDDDEFRMLIAGLRGVGKSALANSICGCKIQDSKSAPGSVTEKASEIKYKTMVGKSSTIFDTPGLSSSGDHELVMKEYKKCLFRAAPGLHVILIVQKATSYSDDNENFLQTITKMFGEDCWKFVVYVFTHIDEIDQGESLQHNIEKGDKRLRYWLKKCGNRYVGINNEAKGEENNQQILHLDKVVENLVKMNDGKIYTNEDFQRTYAELQRVARDRNVSIQSIRDNAGRIFGVGLELLRCLNNL